MSCLNQDNQIACFAFILDLLEAISFLLFPFSYVLASRTGGNTSVWFSLGS